MRVLLKNVMANILVFSIMINNNIGSELSRI